ncbi:hypothetical protein CGMCC3_g17194 [Colletotrichum fructicola]|nr:uncharacterized protein CGMCC3_g17194 [Colletotrichum fructicola]KAE9566673.1 hypothetical protein CGMCC3_g17194 [Colletotrichum fructicola]KAF4414543.1 hypothetical protein CFRS1_v015981 [Colletotrichum fructicola]KAF4417676.1 hypothetical protein CFRS1_v015147 [Colletotrichum fructicola]KAF4881185.1 hypothetical protein CGCFRS4_v015811 [Colletotrichum fructicola]
MAVILAQQLQTVLENDAWQEDDKAQRRVADLISDVICALPSPVADKVRGKICTHCKFGTASESPYAHPCDDQRAALGWEDILGRQQEWINSPKRFFDKPKPLNVVRYLKAWSTKGKYGLLAAIKFRLIAGELHRCRTSWGPRASKFRKALHEAARFHTEAGIEEKDVSEWNAYGRTSVYLSQNFEPGMIIALAETLDSTYQKVPTGPKARETELFQKACSKSVQDKARRFAQLETALIAYLSEICQPLKSVSDHDVELTSMVSTRVTGCIASDCMSVEAPARREIPSLRHQYFGVPLPETGSDHAASLRPACVADCFASEAICPAPQYTSTNIEMLLSSSQPFAHHAAMGLDGDGGQSLSNHHRITCHPLPASSFMHSQSIEGSASLTTNPTRFQTPSSVEPPSPASCAPVLFTDMNMSVVWS